MPFYSEVTYTATPGQTLFEITFEVLRAEWVFVQIDEVDQDPEDYVIDADAAEMRWEGKQLAGDEEVRVYRDTSKYWKDEVVHWVSGPESNRDCQLDQTKLRHHVQELTDFISKIDDGLKLKGAGATMMTLTFEDGGNSAGTATGFEWYASTPDGEHYHTGKELRVRINEGSGYEPQDNNNDEGEITYFAFADDPNTKYNYAVRLTKGRYLLEAHAAFYVDGVDTEELRVGWEVGLQYSDGDADTWHSFPGKFQSSKELSFVSSDPNVWNTQIRFSCQAILDVFDQDFNYVHLLAHDADGHPSRDCGVIGGFLKITKLADLDTDTP